MVKTLIFGILIVALSILMLSVRILLKKNGTFAGTHVSQSKAMRQQGIGCVQSQDFAARHKRKPIKE
ncbi:MAG: hypothetical protein IJV06_11520 [Bacteroidaceae bacterium]|nr:hypothetical protein [Bacteroidaceae bacterium]